MSRLILKIAALVVISGLFNAAMAMPEKAKENIPFNNAMDSLNNQRFDEALSWFTLVNEDFKGSQKSYEASYLKSSILIAKELAALKVANLFLDSTKWFVGKKELTTIDEYEKIARTYQKMAHIAAESMLSEFKPLLKAEMSEEIKKISLSVRINPEGWNVKNLRDSVKKGNVLDSEEIHKLHKGELLTGILGFLSEVVPPFQNNILNGFFNGEVNRVKFYRSFGERFLINAKREDSHKDFYGLAKECFSVVVELTKDDRYSKERKLALKRLKELKSFPKKNDIDLKCKKCGESLEKGWKFCPACGRKK